MRSLHLARIVAPLLLFFIAARAVAQNDPEQAVLTYFSELRAAGPSALARYTHTEDVIRFKAEMQKILAEAEANHALPGALPQGVSLAEAQQMLKEMSAVEFFLEFLQPVVQNFKALGVQFEVAEVLGSVPEGPRVHVLVRSTASRGTKKLTELQVVTVKLDGNRWRLTGGEAMRGFARIAREFGRTQ